MTNKLHLGVRLHCTCRTENARQNYVEGRGREKEKEKNGMEG